MSIFHQYCHTTKDNKELSVSKKQTTVFALANISHPYLKQQFVKPRSEVAQQRHLLRALILREDPQETTVIH